MSKLPVRAVIGETFCHESEDISKVTKAFELFFPKKEIKQARKDAAFGTEIKILSAKIEGKKARILVQKILDVLSPEEKRKLSNELGLRLSDEGKLYLRFDKQKALEDEQMILTNDEDSIQIVFALESFPATESGFIKAASSLLA